MNDVMERPVCRSMTHVWGVLLNRAVSIIPVWTVKRHCAQACVVPKGKGVISTTAFVCRSVRRRVSRLVTVSIVQRIMHAANVVNAKGSVWMAGKLVRRLRSAAKKVMNVITIPIAALSVTINM